jgi:hypothetical protein
MYCGWGVVWDWIFEGRDAEKVNVVGEESNSVVQRIAFAFLPCSINHRRISSFEDPIPNNSLSTINICSSKISYHDEDTDTVMCTAMGCALRSNGKPGLQVKLII